MRQVQFEEAEGHLAEWIDEAATRQGLTIVKAGKPVARLLPIHAADPAVPSEAERAAARKELKAIMEKGYDLGIVWNGRDELYDRSALREGIANSKKQIPAE